MSISERYCETELIQNVAAGDERAFRDLMHAYWDITYRFIFPYLKDKHLAEEQVQDIFVQLWTTRKSLAGVSNFNAYLFVICRNKAINAVRDRMRERNKLKLWGMTQQTATHEEDYVTEENLCKIDDAILDLPPQQQKVWIMSRREGMKYTEIAKSLNISKDAVKRYLQLANASIHRKVHSATGTVLSILIIATYFF